MAQAANSTNVRPHPRPVKLPPSAAVVVGARRLGLRALERLVSPDAAARYAVRLFSTPRRHARPAREAEALQSARRSTLLHAGHAIPVWSWGDVAAPAALLVHGWEGRGAQLAAFVPSLVDLGLRVVTFDAPGHGEAEAPRDNVVDHARALHAVAEHAGDVRLVVAHSMGAAATLLATRFGLSADAYALVAPPSSPAPWVDQFAQFHGLSEDLRLAMVRTIEQNVGFAMSELDAGVDAAALEVPLLVVHDEDDREVLPAEGKKLVHAARDARFVSTRGLGHRRVLRAPEVLAEVEAFAAAFAAPRSGRTPPPRRSRTPSAPESWGASLAATLDAELFFREERWAAAAR